MSLKEKISKIHKFDYCYEAIYEENQNELVIYFGFEGNGNLHFYLSYWKHDNEYLISIWKNREQISNKITNEFEDIKKLIIKILNENI